MVFVVELASAALLALQKLADVLTFLGSQGSSAMEQVVENLPLVGQGFLVGCPDQSAVFLLSCLKIPFKAVAITGLRASAVR